jgi:hypothetical protein
MMIHPKRSHNCVLIIGGKSEMVITSTIVIGKLRKVLAELN